MSSHPQLVMLATVAIPITLPDDNFLSRIQSVFFYSQQLSAVGPLYRALRATATIGRLLTS